MARLARIEALLGVPLEGLDEGAVARLVQGRVKEDTDLEFKQQIYGTSDGAKRDLAGDVASFANAVGGLLVLGICEDDGAAFELTPVELSDEEELRIRQVVASSVAPHPILSIHQVPTAQEPSLGYFLIEIPRSSHAPHAVRVSNGLRYPRRDGSGTRWLSESEVADAYRNRFELARHQVERLGDVRSEGEGALAIPDHEAWLSIGLVPNSPGEMPLTHGSVQGLRDFVRRSCVVALHGSRLRESSADVMAGHRRVVVRLNVDEYGKPRSGLVHLHQDGSGYVAVMVGMELKNQATGDGSGVIHVPDELLTQEVLHAVAVLVTHATANCATMGDATVEATLLSPRMPMRLGHSRSGYLDSWHPEHLVTDAPIGQHTISLDATFDSAHIAKTARMVLNDLVQGFGVAECPQLNENGALRLPYFRNGRQHLPGIAGKLGLELVDEGLD